MHGKIIYLPHWKETRKLSTKMSATLMKHWLIKLLCESLSGGCNKRGVGNKAYNVFCFQLPRDQTTIQNAPNKSDFLLLFQSLAGFDDTFLESVLIILALYLIAFRGKTKEAQAFQIFRNTATCLKLLLCSNLLVQPFIWLCRLYDRMAKGINV